MAVETGPLDEVVVRAVLDDLALVDNEDEVGVANRREAVSDHERGPPLHDLVESVEDHFLGLRVDRGRRLVENQDRCVLDERARDRDALALASGEAGALLADDRVVALRKRGDEVVGVRRARRRADLILGRLQPSVADVLRNRAREEEGLLEHERDLAAERAELDRPDIAPVDENASLLRVVQAGEQAHERRLPCPGRAHNRDAAAGSHLERDVLEGRRTAPCR